MYQKLYNRKTRTTFPTSFSIASSLLYQSHHKHKLHTMSIYDYTTDYTINTACSEGG